MMNSTLSTEDAEITMMDIKHYDLGTSLPIYEYMRLYNHQKQLASNISWRLHVSGNLERDVRPETSWALG
jgi:hypothetical protein